MYSGTRFPPYFNRTTIVNRFASLASYLSIPLHTVAFSGIFSTPRLTRALAMYLACRLPKSWLPDWVPVALSAALGIFIFRFSSFAILAISSRFTSCDSSSNLSEFSLKKVYTDTPTQTFKFGQPGYMESMSDNKYDGYTYETMVDYTKEQVAT